MPDGEHKSLTETALRKDADAIAARRRGDDGTALLLESEVASLGLQALPAFGPAGEVIEPQEDSVGYHDQRVTNLMLAGGNRIAADASLRRRDLLLQPCLDVAATGLDMAQSAGAETSAEKCLMHQLAALHDLSMRIADRASELVYKTRGQSFDPYSHQNSDAWALQIGRYVNMLGTLTRSYQDGMVAHHRVRQGGQQTMTVKHVHVHEGGQAVIGNVTTKGSRKRAVKGPGGVA